MEDAITRFKPIWPYILTAARPWKQLMTVLQAEQLAFVFLFHRQEHQKKTLTDMRRRSQKSWMTAYGADTVIDVRTYK